ncbi:hypothetical protein IAU60_001487 [Kwoniella sp. DSM 27419]
MSAQVSVKPSTTERVKGSHWANDKGTAFVNPWSSFTPFRMMALFKFQYQMMTESDPTLKEAKKLIPHVTPTFGADIPSDQLKATWLGHASVLIETPSKAAPGEKGGRGVRVLFDPILLDKMFHGLGTKRKSTPPCEIADLPELDAIVISHNHYDHLDTLSLTEIIAEQKKQFNKQPLLFLPLNNWHVVTGVGLPRERVIEMDWWEERDIVVDGVGEAKLTCTPAQHQTARSGWDKDNSLWSSWVLKDSASTANVWFGGDTGYCTIKEESHDLDVVSKYPVCPAFKEIGKRLGPFTVGLIPIGAYMPRPVFSGVHASPIDSVRMFQDTECENAIGIHWGTFRMTPERFTEPPEKLKEAIDVVGLKEGAFITVAIGETKGYKVE